jgi:hypothetical protein
VGQQVNDLPDITGMRTPDPAATVPDPVPAPAPRTPLVERVAALEDQLTQLAVLHNRFAGDVSRELGL